MNDILSPQGFEPNEPLEVTDVQEVYQPTSGGARRNKQVTLESLRDFFKKLTSYTSNAIVESDSTGSLRTTSISTASVASAINRSQTNESDITTLEGRVDSNDTDISTLDSRVTSNDGELSTLNSRVNQGVKSTDSPTFANATIGGHNVDSELDTLNSRVNQGVKSTDSPTFANATIGGHNVDSELDTLNSRVSQGVKSTDSPTFEDITITGMTGTVESRIEGNSTNIDTLEGKVGQSLNTTDSPTFVKLTAEEINLNGGGGGVVRTFRFTLNDTQDYAYTQIKNALSPLYPIFLTSDWAVIGCTAKGGEGSLAIAVVNYSPTQDKFTLYNPTGVILTSCTKGNITNMTRSAVGTVCVLF